MRSNTEETQCGSFIPRHLSFICAEYILYFLPHEIKSWKTFTSSDKVSWNSLTSLTPQWTFHLSTWVSPKIKTTVLNSPMLYGDTLPWNLFVKKPCSFLVWRKVKHNLLPFIMFTSILCCSRTSTCLLTSPQVHFRLWYLIIQNNPNPNQRQLSLSSEEWKIPEVF